MKAAIAPILLLAFALMSGTCKHNSPTGPPACDTCSTDTTHKPPPPMDTTSHTFTWTQFSIPNEGILTGCWVFGANDIYVVGGSLWKWDGASWKDVSPRSSRGYTLAGKLSGFSMFAFSETDYWLTDGDITFHYQGNVANDIRTDNAGGSNALHSSWGTSSTDMYVVGDGGTILHFDGTNWTKMQSGTTLNIKTIWGTTDKNIWACGFNPTTSASVLLHYDGSTWTPLDLSAIGDIGPHRHSLNAVWTCDSSGHDVTFASGSLMYRTTDNAIWRGPDASMRNKLSDGTYDGMFNMKGNSANDLLVAGDLGYVCHWNGRSWYRYDALFNQGDGLYITNAASFNGNTACVVGANASGSWIAIGQR